MITTFKQGLPREDFESQPLKLRSRFLFSVLKVNFSSFAMHSQVLFPTVLASILFPQRLKSLIGLVRISS